MTLPAQIYLDNNATTRIDPVVAERMYELHSSGVANPASQHRSGRHALALLEEAKEAVARVVGAVPHGMESAHVILTSGGTEANNLVLHSLCSQQSGILITAGCEHSSILEYANQLPHLERRLLPLDAAGRCDLERLREWLDVDGERVRLISLMFGNNETGNIANLEAVGKIAAQYGVLVHSDAVQAVGKLKVDMPRLGLSALTLTAHKVHGPVGIGALVVRSDLQLRPLLIGGGQQLAVRAGTEPVVLAAGLAAALQASEGAREEGIYNELAGRRAEFERQLLEIDDLYINGISGERLPHVSNIAFVGLDRQALQMALDLAGIACSTGSACASGSGRASRVLLAMGLDPELVSSSLRFSFSRFTTSKELEQAAEIITSVVRRLRSRRQVRSC